MMAQIILACGLPLSHGITLFMVELFLSQLLVCCTKQKNQINNLFQSGTYMIFADMWQIDDNLNWALLTTEKQWQQLPLTSGAPIVPNARTNAMTWCVFLF
jgi:hypothetical protein